MSLFEGVVEGMVIRVFFSEGLLSGALLKIELLKDIAMKVVRL